MLSLRPERTRPDTAGSAPTTPETSGTPGTDRRSGIAGVVTLERSLGLAAALAGFVVAAGVMTDNSLLTHLATGRVILDRGSVPSVDPYSRFGVGQDWTVQSWLVSVIYALLDRLGNAAAAIRVFHGAVGALIGLGLWAITAPAGRIIIRVALTAGPLAVGVGLWSPRPLLVGLAALVGLLLVIQEDRPGWLLIPLLWVWGNAHGSFPLAVGLMVLILAGHRFEDRRLPIQRRRLFGWALLGTILAALGPIGPGLLLFPLRVLGRREAMTGVVEWEAPTYSSPWELAWLGLAVLPLIAARRGLGWHRIVPAAALTVAAALALRNVAPASIVVVAMVAPAFARSSAQESTSPAGAGDGRFRLARAVGLAALSALVVAVASVATRPGLDLSNYPVAEVDQLDQAGLLGSNEIVVVHREAVGNYLTWRLGPQAGVFVDDRFDFHPEPLLADHRDLLAGRGAREILDRRGADVVLWELDTPLADWLDEAAEWSVRRGQEWLVACRVGSEAEVSCPTESMLELAGSS